MNNSWKRFLSLLLAMVMVLSLGVTGFADDGNTEDPTEGPIVPTDETDPAENPDETASGEVARIKG